MDNWIGKFENVDWFDVTTSTIASKLGFGIIGIIGKSFIELANASVEINIDEKGIILIAIAYKKENSSIILDLTFSLFKTLVGEVAKDTHAPKPSEEAMKKVFDQLKTQLKESIKAQSDK